VRENEKENGGGESSWAHRLLLPRRSLTRGRFSLLRVLPGKQVSLATDPVSAFRRGRTPTPGTLFLASAGARVTTRCTRTLRATGEGGGEEGAGQLSQNNRSTGKESSKRCVDAREQARPKAVPR